MREVYEHDNELFYENGQPVEDDFRFAEGDVIHYERMPIDKDGRHATGVGVFQTNTFSGRLVDVPTYYD